MQYNKTKNQKGKVKIRWRDSVGDSDYQKIYLKMWLQAGKRGSGQGFWSQDFSGGSLS